MTCVGRIVTGSSHFIGARSKHSASVLSVNQHPNACHKVISHVISLWSDWDAWLIGRGGKGRGGGGGGAEAGLGVWVGYWFFLRLRFFFCFCCLKIQAIIACSTYRMIFLSYVMYLATRRTWQLKWSTEKMESTCRDNGQHAKIVGAVFFYCCPDCQSYTDSRPTNRILGNMDSLNSNKEIHPGKVWCIR